jgi:hypothetical protein
MAVVHKLPSPPLLSSNQENERTEETEVLANEGETDAR